MQTPQKQPFLPLFQDFHPFRYFPRFLLVLLDEFVESADCDPGCFEVEGLILLVGLGVGVVGGVGEEGGAVGSGGRFFFGADSDDFFVFSFVC